MYLLSSQCFADIASRDADSNASRWLRDTRPGSRELFVSAISIGCLTAEVERLPTDDRGPWRRLLAEARRTFHERDCVIEPDMRIIDQWSYLRNLELYEDGSDGEPGPLGEDERLVIATAISRDLTLVTPDVAYLAGLADKTTLKYVIA